MTTLLKHFASLIPSPCAWQHPHRYKILLPSLINSNRSPSIRTISCLQTSLLNSNLHQEFQTAFEPTIRGNNMNFGFVQAIVNMSYVQPPQRKGRAPNTHKENFLTYKKNFVQLEQLSVFKKVEDVGVVAENLNPFFLIKKLAGGYHLVT